MTDHAATRALPTWRLNWDFRRFSRTAVFFLFAALILLGPFAAQVLHVRHVLARPWVMFAGVGVGILNGEFQAVAPDGSAMTLKPLQLLGAERYPVTRSTEFPLRIVKDGDLRKFAERFCANNNVKLSYSGFVGSREGWRVLNADNLCAITP